MNYLFSSPHSYLDYSSGAAISTRSALRAFVRQGEQVDVFCGTYFDDPKMNERAFFRLLKSLNAPIKVTELRLKDDAAPRSFRLVEFDDSGINASFLLAEDSFRASSKFFPMNSVSNRLFFHLLNKKLDATRPDVSRLTGAIRASFFPPNAQKPTAARRFFCFTTWRSVRANFFVSAIQVCIATNGSGFLVSRGSANWESAIGPV